MKRRQFLRMSSAAFLAIPLAACRRSAREEPSRMLHITWSRGPDLPQGFQDSDGGFIGSVLVTAGGFCSGENTAKKPGRYPRGFLKKAWAWDATRPQEPWSPLPDFPGAARQEHFAISLNNALYTWGGFSYESPYTYQDGYVLSQQNGTWGWDALPDLPHRLCSSGICAIGSRIYICGGADYDYEKFYTDTDRTGETARLGARLYVIDTDNLATGWQQLTDCPGTPRWVHAMASAQRRIYVIGGATGSNPTAEGQYCSVVDNWMYDPADSTWTRLADLPISSGNFPGGSIVYRDRYVLLVGGYQYDKVANPDGTVRDKYGQPTRVRNQGKYFNDVFVYDTQSRRFGTADSMPVNNNLPMAVLRDDELFLLGGEIDQTTLDGEYYGHHPDLFLRGKVQETA